jgi:hypothetical protein
MKAPDTWGPDSRTEWVLSLYNLEAGNWGEDILQSDTDRLLLATLLELRGQGLVQAVDEAQAKESETDPWVASTDTPGQTEAVELKLGNGPTPFDLFYQLDGSATVTIEVSQDGTTWRPFETIDAGETDPAEDMVQFETAYERARVFAEGVAEDNLDVLEIVRGD